MGFRNSPPLGGRLGGSVGEVPYFGSGHDLTVCEFEPHIGFCADSLELGACLSLSVTPLLMLCISLSQKK